MTEFDGSLAWRAGQASHRNGQNERYDQFRNETVTPSMYQVAPIAPTAGEICGQTSLLEEYSYMRYMSYVSNIVVEDRAGTSDRLCTFLSVLLFSAGSSTLSFFALGGCRLSGRTAAKARGGGRRKRGGPGRVRPEAHRAPTTHQDRPLRARTQECLPHECTE
jgi:hypothetical protein